MGKIEWCDRQINPITGCKKGCPYCYAKDMAQRFHRSFRPAFHPDRLVQIMKLRGKGKKIFLDSAGDWFSDGVEPEWVRECIDIVRTKPEHTFLVLTKWPENILKLIGGPYQVPDNLWLGVSVTEQTDTWRIRELEKVCCKRFISFEPLHGPIHTDLSKIHWIIIGAETGKRKGKIIPEEDWVKSIFNCVPDDSPFPFFLKDNLMQYLPDWVQLKDFPEEMLR